MNKRNIKKVSESQTEEEDFVAVASHQLRTPLTIMNGYLAMILAGDFGSLDDKLKAALTAVWQANERMLRLVENLLNASRLEGGKLKVFKTKIELSSYIKALVEEIKPKAEGKNLYLRSKVLGKKTILADELLLHQAIVNLLDNAIKYTKQGGVMIEVKALTKHVLIIVSDSGPGLNQRQLKDLFSKFSRYKVKGSSEKGFGLGLYVSKMIIEAHQGIIKAEKNQKGGLKITIKLPVK